MCSVRRRASRAGILGNTIRAFDITYSGVFNAESLLPPGWTIVANSFRIIAFNMGEFNPIEFFNYTGDFSLVNVIIGDSDLWLYSGNIINEDEDNWELKTSVFSTDERHYTDYNKTRTATSGISNTRIVTNNLISRPNEFFYEDGTEYNGEYHQHEDFQAMSGGEHDSSSVNIYRKDSKGRLYIPGKYKRSRNFIKNIKNIQAMQNKDSKKKNLSDWSPSQETGGQSSTGGTGGSGGGTY